MTQLRWERDQSLSHRRLRQGLGRRCPINVPCEGKFEGKREPCSRNRHPSTPGRATFCVKRNDTDAPGINTTLPGRQTGESTSKVGGPGARLRERSGPFFVARNDADASGIESSLFGLLSPIRGDNLLLALEVGGLGARPEPGPFCVPSPEPSPSAAV
jgi:hypothetical protein